MIRIKLLYEELSTLALTEANYPNFALRLHKNFISASPKNMPPRMGSNRTVAISSGEITTKISIIPLKQEARRQQITCTGGRTWSSSLNSCVCPRGLNWNGAICLACDNGSNWNGFSCIVCDNGQIWSSTQSICQCPTGQQWNGTACITLCRQGMVNINGVCSCQVGFYDLNGVCTREPSCPSGQTWNGLRCTQISCPVGTFWNGTVCATSSNIVCPAGTFFDGSGCITNITNCPTGTRWSGSSCVASSNCPNGTYLNGSSFSIHNQLLSLFVC